MQKTGEVFGGPDTVAVEFAFEVVERRRIRDLLVAARDHGAFRARDFPIAETRFLFFDLALAFPAPDAARVDAVDDLARTGRICRMRR